MKFPFAKPRTPHAVVLGAFAFLTLIATPAIADAPPDQYALFTRDAPTVEDVQTHLVWQHTATTIGDPANGPQECAKAGFRLPTIRELLSLYDDHSEFYRAGRLISIDQAAFGSDSYDAPYLSSTTRLGLRFSASTAEANENPIVAVAGGPVLLRCVR